MSILVFALFGVLRASGPLDPGKWNCSRQKREGSVRFCSTSGGIGVLVRNLDEIYFSNATLCDKYGGITG